MSNRRDVAGLGPLALDWSGFHDWLERWAPLAEWGVAAGTFALAVATFVLARRVRDEAAAVRDEATRVAEQAVASLRAYVYPETSIEWAWNLDMVGGTVLRDKALPLRNGGPGVALNVTGHVRRGTEGDPIALYVGSIAPGQAINARLAHPIEGGWGGWAGTWLGDLLYGDLNGDQWTTGFTITLRDGQLVVEHEPPTQRAAETA